MTILKEEDFRLLAELAKEMIISRTRTGISSEGDTFKQKEDGSKSNLVDTGRLLSTLRVIVQKDGAFVTPTVSYAKYVAMDRPFMDLTEQETERLIAEAVRLYKIRGKERINELFRRN